MVVSITLSDDEYKFISEYAAQENLSVEKFILASTLEQIENKDDLKLCQKAESDLKQVN